MTIDSSITYILPIKDNRNHELELSEGEMDVQNQIPAGSSCRENSRCRYTFDVLSRRWCYEKELENFHWEKLSMRCAEFFVGGSCNGKRLSRFMTEIAVNHDKQQAISSRYK